VVLQDIEPTNLGESIFQMNHPALSCFKAYDVRGRLGEELNGEIAYRIGRAYAQHLNARRVVVGGDVRNTSEPLKQALANGLMDGGADVIDIGMCGTEEVYFAAFHLNVDGGIEVTASHNPMDYNGMKFVGRGAMPISGDSGLQAIRQLAEANDFTVATRRGALVQQSVLLPYVEHLLNYIDLSGLKPLRLVVNSGNGAAGHVIDVIEQKFLAAGVPVEFIKVHHEPDGNFPNGIPNPLLPENRAATAEAVRQHGADMGIAWDGDFDRCFLFDESGEFIEGYYIVGLLAEAFLKKHPGEKIIHDPRLTWNTIEVVTKAGGQPIQSKTGHAFIKERMRAENAIYGGEMSAHHYFRDFAYCDSGMIPWLLVAELVSRSGKPLSALVAERVAAYPCSGEINYRVADAAAGIRQIQNHFAANCLKLDETDGLSMEFADWRFNLRMSNTEPLLRLNVETRTNRESVKKYVTMIETMIAALPGNSHE
jgi:phosphomannomutase/phosphomannomutase/phosphoglucomutase